MYSLLYFGIYYIHYILCGKKWNFHRLLLFIIVYYYSIIIPRDNLLDYTIIVSWSFIFYELIIDSLLSYIKIRLNNIMYFIMIV